MTNTTLGTNHLDGKFLPRAQGLSVALHGGLLVILLIPALAPPPDILGIRDTPLIFPGMAAVSEWKVETSKSGKNNSGGGGGGAHDKGPARNGGLPPFMRLQITPPGRPQPDATLLVPPTLVGPNFTHPSAKLPNLGDPNSKLLNDFLGSGSRGGVGDGNRSGVGPGQGPGFGPGQDGWLGGPGKIAVAGRDGVGTPVCSYCPNPTFTDEAIRVRYQGSVALRLVVNEEGKPTNISVIRTAGLGLDERAKEAVRTWRFTPARDRDGRPIATWVMIEVMFRQF